MAKNIAIGLLVLFLVAETGYIIFTEKSSQHLAATEMHTTQTPSMPPAGPNARGGGRAPVMISKGMDLTKTPLFPYVYEIAPQMTDAAKQKITGFSVNTQTQADGSMIVTLTPKDSEDQSQQYTIKQGMMLYFVEQTPLDDKTDQDKDLNYRDDYGIITDSKGIVQ